MALSALLASCGKDYQSDIDNLNGKYTKIDQRVSTIETQVKTMNTQLSQLSVLATAVEQNFYVTQVKTITDGYELTLSNGKTIILQNGPDNLLTPMPAVSMTEIGGFFYWTLNGLLLTDATGKPIRSTGKAPIVRYDFTKLVWLVSVDGGVTFQDVNILASVIINDEVLMQVINSYVRQHSTTIISQEMLFQIISTYIQQNYAQLFSVELLDQVVATYIKEHYTRIFSYELLEKIFSQYNFSYITANINVEEIVNAIIIFIHEHQEVFLNNDVLFEIVSSYMEMNKTTVFSNELLLEVINNFMQNNTDFIDVDLLTLVVSNYIEQHQDELFNSETVGKLILEYVGKYYTEIFSQDILIRLVSTYVTQNKTTIFNETLISEVLNNYVQNNYNTIVKQETITEIINNYLKKNTTTVFNRDVLIDVISTYFSKNYNLFIDNTVISKAVNDYISAHQTTIISAEVVSHIVNNYLEQYCAEVFTRDMLTQVVNNYFEKNMQVITEHISQGSSLVRKVTVSDDLCTVYLNGGKSVDLVIYDDMARLRDRVQSIVVLPNASGRADYDKWHNEVNLRCLVSPSAMASVIEEKCRKDEMSMELVVTDGTSGFVNRVPVTYYSAQDGILTVNVSSLTDIKAVALHIKENKTGATDIMTEFIPVGEESQQKSYLKCPDDHHPHMIDLGLPSGTLWSCCNVGASKPEDYGGKYAWGETWTKDTYTWDSYRYGSSSTDVTYIGNNIAGTIYDVAHVKWEGSWCMPTRELCIELIKNSEQKDMVINGKKVTQFTGSNGGKIFMPHEDSQSMNSYYWTSDKYVSDNSAYIGYAYCYGIAKNGYSWTWYVSWPRYFGILVRPVASPNNN